jgi:hypothetical protein
MPLTSGAKDTSYATWALTGQHADWALTRSWQLPGSGSSPAIAGDDAQGSLGCFGGRN